MLQYNILNQRLEALKAYKNLNPTHIESLKEAIETQEDLELLRINPIQFGKLHAIPKSESIDLFVHAVKVGILDFHYNLLCPFCGGIVHSHEALDNIQSEEFYCATCNLTAPTTLDDQVEVSFSPNSAIKKLNLNPYNSLEDYLSYNFSSNHVKAKPHIDLVLSLIKKFYVIEPDSQIELELEPPKTNSFQFCSIATNSSSFLHFTEDIAEEKQTLEINLLSNSVEPKQVQLKQGKVLVTVKNLSKIKIGLVLITPNLEAILETVKVYPPTKLEFLIGKMLLNNQAFRELFRVQNLSESMKLNIKNLTIMFTDLKGSTEMYDRAGDILAYKLVQEHFDILTEVVKAHSGAIIKTMGDAIMATFSNPLDGLLASLDMLTKIEKMNQTWRPKGYEIGLKIGLHDGPALAVVNDEKLDYFGQSVNIAARVQALAQSGEIWITENIYSSSGVKEKLQAYSILHEQHSVQLKGVGSSTKVFKCYANTDFLYDNTTSRSQS